MNEEFYQQLNADLGFEFDLFAVENPEWLEKNVPGGAIVVLQTDTAGFNAWARKTAENVQRSETPRRPLVLVRILELLPVHSRIVRAEAELVPGTH